MLAVVRATESLDTWQKIPVEVQSGGWKMRVGELDDTVYKKMLFEYPSNSSQDDLTVLIS